MSDSSQELPYSGAIRMLGLAAGVLTIFSTLSGVLMLLLKWQTGSAPEILSIIPLTIMPLAFLALLAALFLAILRRKAV